MAFHNYLEEDKALVYRLTSAGTDGYNYAKRIWEFFVSGFPLGSNTPPPGSSWRYETHYDNTLTATFKLLLEREPVLQANPLGSTLPLDSVSGVTDKQQIYIVGTEANLKIGYSPNGALTLDLFGVLTVNADRSWTGERSITGTSGLFQLSPATEGPGLTMWIAQYLDTQIERGRGASLTILLSNYENNGLLYGCHVGRILVPDNDIDYHSTNLSDYSYGLNGDALLVGKPTPDATTSGNWLCGNFAEKDNSSVVRVGPRKWSFFAVMDKLQLIPILPLPPPPSPPQYNIQRSTNPFQLNPVLTPQTFQLNEINTITKPIPYTIMGLGTAQNYVDFSSTPRAQENYEPVDYTLESPSAGRIGQTKYLRAFRFNMENFNIVASFHPDSEQAWLGWNYGTAVVPPIAQHNQTILWNKITNVF